MPTDLTTLSGIYEKLNQVAMTPGISFEVLCDEFLKAGQSFFEMELAIVSEIEEDSYFIYAVTENSRKIEKGVTIPLGNTLCREILEKRKTSVHHNLSENTELANHPAYTEMGLKSYIGAPIWLGSKLFGTLNFSSGEAKDQSFCSEEIAVLNTMALLLAKQLEIDLEGQTNALMLQNLTHELRSPLNGILGSNEILAETSLDQDQFELVDLVARSSKKLEEKVADLSLFIKVNREIKSARPCPQNPVELTKKLLKEIVPTLKVHDIFFKHTEAHLSDILVTPAIYTASVKAILSECYERSRERKEIEISYRQIEGHLQVVIRDNGPQLSSSVFDVINHFGRIDFNHTSFSTQGINLNLSLAAILMQLAGGHLRVKPIKKEDNEFVLSFPKKCD